MMLRNVELDILRGYAIVGTFLAHVRNFGVAPASIEKILTVPAWGMGVDIFFVLSGYLITTSLMRSREANDHKKTLQIFWIKRSLRIIPVSTIWIVVAAVVSLLFSYGGDKSGVIGTVQSAFAATLNYANVYWSHCISHGLVNSVCGGGANFAVWWSLSLEEQFYIVFPLIFLFMSRSFATIIPVGIIVYFSFNDRFFANLHWMMRFDGMAYGVLLALHKDKIASMIDLSRVPEAFRRYFGFGILGFIFIIGGMAYRFPDYNSVLFSATIFGCFICVLLASENSGYFKAPVIGGLVGWLGAISFSFYLCHETVLALASTAVSTLFPDLPSSIAFIVMVLLSFLTAALISYLSMRFVEKPTIAMGSTFAKRVERRT